jgi:hypothetical protein
MAAGTTFPAGMGKNSIPARLRPSINASSAFPPGTGLCFGQGLAGGFGVWESWAVAGGLRLRAGSQANAAFSFAKSRRPKP